MTWYHVFFSRNLTTVCSVTQIPIVPATLLLHCKTSGSYDGSWHEIDYAIGETISHLSIIDSRQETGRLPGLVSLKLQDSTSKKKKKKSDCNDYNVKMQEYRQNPFKSSTLNETEFKKCGKSLIRNVIIRHLIKVVR